MSKLLLHPLVLRSLYCIALGKAFLRYRNPRRRQSGRHQEAFYRQTWCQAAERLGGSYMVLDDTIGEIQLNGVRTRVFDNVSEIDDPVTLAVLHNKPLTHRILQEQGLPVPQHARFSFGDMTPAVQFLAGHPGDCVVKPAGGTGGGRGVTTGIRTTHHLARAAAAAAVYADDLLIEEQVEGDNYRLLYLDGELIDAFVRRCPAVVGDGHSTVRQLVERANDERLASQAGISQVLLSIDLDMRRTLARQKLSLRSVPQAGQRVSVKTVINENSGADNTTVTHELHPAIIEAGKRAVKALRVRFAGIDLVTKDHTRPLEETGGVILEVNGTPNLYYHYTKQDGCCPVAEHLLRRLLEDKATPLNCSANLAFTPPLFMSETPIDTHAEKESAHA